MKIIEKEQNLINAKIFEELNNKPEVKIRIHIKNSAEQAKKEMIKIKESRPLSAEEKILAFAKC